MSKGSIVYYAGKAAEAWTPESLNTGIGGSETAVIYLTREWAKSGYNVTVYGNCGTKEGVYEGVQYLSCERFNPDDEFDTLIIWRQPEMLDTRFKAKRVWLDLQDILDADDFTSVRIENVDILFVKSTYQRYFLPHVPNEKFAIVPNGVDPSWLDWREPEKDPYKLIYASGYGRGLELMLTHGWSMIRNAIPDAHLHIYYGWNLYDACYGNQPEYIAWKQKMIELMNQPGITEYGRVGQPELMEAKATATIHYYAATCEETDCISARESVTVGCIPVTTDYAVFHEKNYCIKIPGDPHAPTTQMAVAQKVVDLLKDPTQLESIRQRSKAWVKTETWDRIAQLWLAQMILSN